MYWAIGIGAGVLGLFGLLAYLMWLRFMGRVYREHGVDALTKVAEVMPPPRWHDSLASTVAKLAAEKSGKQPVEKDKPHGPD